MRRSLSLALVVSTTFAVAGCGEKTPATSDPSGAVPGEVGTSSSAPSSSAPTSEASEEEEAEEADASGSTEKYVPESVKNAANNSSSSSGYPPEYTGGSSYESSSLGYGSSSDSGRGQTGGFGGVLEKFASLLGYPDSAISVSGNPAIDDNLLQLIGVVKPNSVKKQTMEERSRSVFEAGRFARATDLLIASAIAGDQDAISRLADMYRWNSIAKKPVLGSRIAIGLNLVNTSNLTELRPIGTPVEVLAQRVNPPTSGSASSGSGSTEAYPNPYGSSLSPGSGQPTSNAPQAKELTDATGEFSKMLLEEINKSYAEGVWGVAFQQNKFNSTRPAQPGGALNANGSMGYPGSYGSGAYPFQNGGGPAVGAISQAASSGSLIPTSSPSSEEMSYENSAQSGYPQTGYPQPGYPQPGYPQPGYPQTGYPDSGTPGGYGSTDLSGMYGGAPNPGGPARAPQINPADLQLPPGIAPVGNSVDFIGVDTQNKLLQTASAQGYDILVVFDVEVSLNRRNGIVSNTARAKAITVASDPKEAKVIGSTKPLNNVTVAKARSKSENDGLAEATQELIKKMVDATKLSPIPANLTADGVAKVRIPRLLQDESISKLGKLGEVSFYYAHGYIDASQRDSLFSQIAGKSAETLLAGASQDARNEAITELLR